MRCTGYRSVDEAHVGTGGCLDALYRVSECRRGSCGDWWVSRCVVPGIGVSTRLMWGLVGV